MTTYWVEEAGEDPVTPRSLLIVPVVKLEQDSHGSHCHMFQSSPDNKVLKMT